MVPVLMLIAVWKADEYLLFRIQYGFIHAGFATMEVREASTTYKFVSRAWTNDFFTKIYKVDNYIESICTADFKALRYYKKTHEGPYRDEEEIIFDTTTLKFTFKRAKAETQYGDIPPNIIDVLSAFYLLRTKLNADPVKIDVHSYGQNWPLEVKILGKEKVKVPFGEFSCIVLEPVMRGEGIFKAKGKLIIYVTDDERKIPVMLKSRVMVGFFSAVLIDAKNI